jgi:hypothetical protein
MTLSRAMAFVVVFGFVCAAAWGQAGGGSGGNQSGGGNGGGGGNGAGKAPSVSGTILSVGQGSFVILDTKGVATTVPFSAGTSFLMNKTQTAAQDVLTQGMKVKATAAPDGSAAQVVASGMATSLNVNQLQAFLGSPDDEWSVLKPKIEKIRAIKSELSGNGGGSNAGGNGNATAPPAPSPLEVTSQSLSAAAFGSASPQQLTAALEAQRKVKGKLTADLMAAKQDLLKILTPRQEALLVAINILE